MPNGSKCWCFTINNPVRGEDPMPSDDALYLVWQLEEGKEGTLHFQGYVEMKSRRTLAAMKKLAPTAHWEQRKGTRDEARDYCFKSETKLEGPWEKGEWDSGQGQGKRSDIAEAMQFTLTHNEKETADTFPSTWARYYRSLERYKTLSQPDRTEKTKVLVLWGPTGTGKTTMARSLLPNAYWLHPPKESNNVWWDGYNGTDDVIIDEFYGWIKFNALLRLLDFTPMRVEIKSSTIKFAPKNVIITSNKHPTNWYTYKNFDFAPLRRRLEGIAYFNELGDDPVWEEDSMRPATPTSTQLSEDGEEPSEQTQ